MNFRCASAIGLTLLSVLFQFLASAGGSVSAMPIGSAQPPSRVLVAIGGGDRTPVIISKIRDISTATFGESNVLMIAWASEEPTAMLEAVSRDLKLGGLVDLTSAPLTAQLTPAQVNSMIEAIRRAQIIFFTGGDQSQLMSALNSNPSIVSEIQAAYVAGKIMVGTSAGTAFMSHVMLTGQGAEDEISANSVETIDGFGFVTQCVFDQHFLKRQRQNRMLSVLLKNPTLTGVGIDEATAVILRNEHQAEVIGRSWVSVFRQNGQASTRASFELTLFKSSERFDL